MKNIFTIICTGLMLGLSAQVAVTDVEASEEQPNTSAILDIQSAENGLLVPRITDAAMTNLETTAADGLIVFNRDDKCFYGFQNGAWKNLDGNCPSTQRLAREEE